jgi:RNA polymerase sigma-54 factor
MELGLSQHQTIKQIQVLSPQMYMSMEILCLNSLDLAERIETELENNETLDRADAPKAEEAAPAAPAQGVEGEREDPFDAKVEQWDNYTREEYGSSRSVSSYDGAKDEKLEALSNTEGRPTSLQEHLEAQVHLLDDAEIVQLVGGLPLEDVTHVVDLCVDIIYNIDNRGYLMYSLEDIQVSLESKPSLDALKNALLVVQSLDPPGVGGRDLKECLILQLRRDRQQYPLEEKIIQGDLEDLGNNRLPKIAKALGATLEEVKTASGTSRA